jgi:hypothetical protein
MRRRLGAADPMKATWPTPATARLLVRLRSADQNLTRTLLRTLKTTMGMRKSLRGNTGWISYETVLWPKSPWLRPF